MNDLTNTFEVSKAEGNPCLGRRCFIWPSRYHIQSWFIFALAFWQWRGFACLCNDILLWGSTAACRAKLHSNSRFKKKNSFSMDRLTAKRQRQRDSQLYKIITLLLWFIMYNIHMSTTWSYVEVQCFQDLPPPVFGWSEAAVPSNRMVCRRYPEIAWPTADIVPQKHLSEKMGLANRCHQICVGMKPKSLSLNSTKRWRSIRIQLDVQYIWWMINRL